MRLNKRGDPDCPVVHRLIADTAGDGNGGTMHYHAGPGAQGTLIGATMPRNSVWASTVSFSAAGAAPPRLLRYLAAACCSASFSLKFFS